MRADETLPGTPQKPGSNEWPALVRRIVDDLARIVQTEIALFQAGLEPILSGAIDRVLASVVALAAFIVGAICLLAALTVFLQERLGWAPAFALTGAVSIATGLVCAQLAKRRTDRSRAELERTFRRQPARPNDQRHDSTV